MARPATRTIADRHLAVLLDALAETVMTTKNADLHEAYAMAKAARDVPIDATALDWSPIRPVVLAYDDARRRLTDVQRSAMLTLEDVLTGELRRFGLNLGDGDTAIAAIVALAVLEHYSAEGINTALDGATPADRHGWLAACTNAMRLAITAAAPEEIRS